MEIELVSDEEYHRAHGVDAGIAARLAFGSLEQTIERFEEVIGLPSLCTSHDAVEVAANHFGYFLHRLNFGSHDIGAPLCLAGTVVQGRNNIDLFALKNLSQLFAVQPSASSTLGRDMGNQRIQGNLAIRQLDARNTNLERTFMLEEV